MTSKAAIVFLRVPEKGRVKTRLSKSLSESFVLELYKGFVEDSLEALEGAGDKILYFWPPGKERLLEKWLGTHYFFSPQQGNDIGEKMANAFHEIFEKGYTRAVLVGTDIPELTGLMISRAHKLLSAADAVIGPAEDGGYYLIGFQKNKFSKSVFQNIDWSTGRVLDQTITAMDRESIQYKLIDKLHDIDTLKDLKALTERAEKSENIGRRTLENLSACQS